MDSDPEVHRFLGNNPISTKAQALESIRGVRKQYEKNGIGRWTVVKKDTNEFLGWSGLKYEEQIRKEFNYFDLGYRFRREYWGNGYATETAKASLEYAFATMKLEEVCAAAEAKHVASNRILSKIGLQHSEIFEFEGTPCNFYRLSRAEWLKKVK